MLEIVDPGFMTTVQDRGRPDGLRLGFPLSGAMDDFALLAANQVVGNAWNAAGLECYAEGPLMTADRDLLAAGAGAGYVLTVGTCSYPLWTAVFVPRGELFGLRSQGMGRWGYLAVSGGIDTPAVLGSRATYLRIGMGGLEGRTIHFGDHLPTGMTSVTGSLQSLTGRSVTKELTPAYSESAEIAVVPGPQFDDFIADERSKFFETSYTISERSDRMGYRLEGRPVFHLNPAGILSEGAVPGTVQIPPDGQPVVLQRDAQTTGGYAKIGVVASADFSLLVQCPLGSGQVRFSVTTVTLARERWQRKLQELQGC